MADNPIRIGIEVDTSQTAKLTAAAKEVGASVTDMAQRFMASGLSAKEAASALQNMGASAKEAAIATGTLSAAQVELAASSEVAAAGMSGFDKAAAMAGGRIAGMELGLGMAGGALGRMAQYLGPIGPLFELALPIALVAMFIPKIEELMDADLKLADAVRGVAEESGKGNDEIIKLNEAYTRITKGPMAEYRQQLADIGSMSLNLGSETKALTAELDAQASTWNFILAKMEDVTLAGIAFGKAFMGDPAAMKQLNDQTSFWAYSARDAQKAITIINDKVLTAKDVTAAIKAIEDEITKAKERQKEEAAQNRVIDAQRTQDAINMLEADKQYLQNQQTIAADKTRNAKAEEDHTVTGGLSFAKQQEAIVKMHEFWKKFDIEQAAELKKVYEDAGKAAADGAKDLSEQMAGAAKQLTDMNIANAQADLHTVEDSMKQIQLAKESADLGRSGAALQIINTEQAKTAIPQLQADIGILMGTMERLKADMSSISSQPIITEKDQENLKAYGDEMDRLKEKVASLESEILKLQSENMPVWQQIQMDMENAAQAGFNSFNSGLIKMIEGGQSFARTMQAAWTSMATGFITDVLKMGEKWVEQHIIMAAAAKLFSTMGFASGAGTTAAEISAGKAQIASDAGVAAAGAYASQAWIPLVGPELGAAAASAAFAQVMGYMAFEQGGIVPGRSGMAVPAIVHGGEMVLPTSLSRKMQESAGGAGRHIHMTYAPTVNAISSKGVADVLREHGEVLGGIMQDELRRANLA